MISLVLFSLILCSLFYVCFFFKSNKYKYRKETSLNIKKINDINENNDTNNNDNIIVSKGFGNSICNSTMNNDDKGKRSLQKRKYQELKKLAKSKSSIQKLVSGSNNTPDKGMSTSARTKFW